jgi:uncharacterized protein YndB with AHSA1/START domain
MNRWIVTTVWLALAAGPAFAETSAVAPTGFVVTVQRDVNAPPEKLWSAITQLPAWWNSAHTWSGKASNMSVDLHAGGCWCESWDGASVMHGTVLFIQPGKVLRFNANLGPLQDRATILKVIYKIAGPPDAGLVELAPAVDKVIAEQVGRLVKLAETGTAD